MRVPYTDPRVARVFEHWRVLVSMNCFSRNHASSSWQESQALVYTGKAAMMLIGQFHRRQLSGGHARAHGVRAVPAIASRFRPLRGRARSTRCTSRRGRATRQTRRRFLAFVMRADVQEALNKATLQIPVNLRSAVAADRFIVQGRDLLARADGLAQYFDRDTSEDLANIAMKGFQEFMLIRIASMRSSPASSARAFASTVHFPGRASRDNLQRRPEHQRRTRPRTRNPVGTRRGGLSTIVLLAPCVLAVRPLRPLPARGEESPCRSYDWNGYDAATWIGLDNYRELARRSCLPTRARKQPALARVLSRGARRGIGASRSSCNQRLPGMRAIRSLRSSYRSC